MQGELKRQAAPVYLADLVHPRNQIRTFPYAAGCVGAYLAETMGEAVVVEVFRETEDFGRAVERTAPAVVGFTNYLWNLALDDCVVTRLKERYPEAVVVMGGPNYPEVAAEQQAFLADRPLVDFYVANEGEIPFARLVRALADVNFDVDALKASRVAIPAVHYLQDGCLIAPAAQPRPRGLRDFPSPYLAGLLDKFFADPALTPLLQSKRGCPFGCTFCVEGASYYTKIAGGAAERFVHELAYVAERVAGPAGLYIADSNFGMYAEDLALCDAIAEVRERTGWPETIEVSTGKNRKERIIDAVRRSRGAIRFGPALQTTNPETLRNVRRENISETAFFEMAGMARELGQRSYTELILGLPGDDVEAHRASIRAAMDGGMQRVKMYPLVLLPGTEMATPASRRRFGLETRFRVLPQCHGTYSFLEESFCSAEVVEVVVATKSMARRDMLAAKQFELSVEIFYNDLYLEEIHGFVKWLGLSMFDFVDACHARRERFPLGLSRLYTALQSGFERDLFPSRQGCEAFYADPENLRRHATTEHESSLGTLKAIALVDQIESVLEISRGAIVACLAGTPADRPAVRDYVDELLRYCLLRRRGLLDGLSDPVDMFRFAFDEIREHAFIVEPERFRLAAPRRMRFWHDEEQARGIQHLAERVSDPQRRARDFIYPASDPAVNPYLRKCSFH